MKNEITFIDFASSPEEPCNRAKINFVSILRRQFSLTSKKSLDVECVCVCVCVCGCVGVWVCGCVWVGGCV